MKISADNIRTGLKVRYVPSDNDKAIANWGTNADPATFLNPSCVYVIHRVDVHSSHTKIWLEGAGGPFDSVHFEVVENVQQPESEVALLKAIVYEQSKVINAAHKVAESRLGPEWYENIAALLRALQEFDRRPLPEHVHRSFSV